MVSASQGVLANDLDVDSAVFTAELLVDAQHGELANADGSFTYTPAIDYLGADFFIYRATDGALYSAATTVSLNVLSASQLIVINEIMYHPALTLPTPENTGAEFIELKNVSASDVDVTGWQFTKGVSYTLPAATIPAGGYLVVAANLATFQGQFPGVTNVFGGWTGRYRIAARRSSCPTRWACKSTALSTLTKATGPIAANCAMRSSRRRSAGNGWRRLTAAESPWS